MSFGEFEHCDEVVNFGKAAFDMGKEAHNSSVGDALEQLPGVVQQGASLCAACLYSERILFEEVHLQGPTGSKCLKIVAVFNKVPFLHFRVGFSLSAILQLAF